MFMNVCRLGSLATQNMEAKKNTSLNNDMPMFTLFKFVSSFPKANTFFINSKLIDCSKSAS